MKTLRRLALTADIVALATIVLGSWTRINGAGETCPDWPLCHGSVLPTMSDGTVWEWMHRLLAVSIAPLIVLLLVCAWRVRARSPFITPITLAIGVLFVVQVLLGAATVQLANSPISVVLHWATAMAFVAALSSMAIFASTAPPPGERTDSLRSAPLCAALLATASLAFITMCIGAYVSASGAGLACLSLAGCAGNVVVYSSGQAIQMLHRIAAGATLLGAAATLGLAWARPASGRVRAFVSIGVALVCVQVLLGLLNVALRLPIELREAHAVNAAFTFLAFVIAMTLALLDSGITSAQPVTAGR
ncbi:MAG: heme A synthase [Candidatus Eremiobacteraeota bacterium]|nr:heme A synthase [Candidatus Eremiobacteraeota bacterium]